MQDGYETQSGQWEPLARTFQKEAVPFAALVRVRVQSCLVRCGGRKRGHLAAYHGEARTRSPALLRQAPSLPPSVPFGDLLSTCQALWGPSESLSSEMSGLGCGRPSVTLTFSDGPRLTLA